MSVAMIAVFVFSGLFANHDIRASLDSTAREPGREPSLSNAGFVQNNTSPLAPGDPDSTFGGTGKVSLNLPGNTNEYAEAVAIQANGQVVVAGTDNTDFRFVRYNTDGNLDSTFGVNGVATVDFGTTESLYDVAIQADGKIVAVGAFNIQVGDRHFAVARLNTDGSLDTSFDGDGKLTYNALPGGNDYAVGVAIQADQKIVISGLYEPSSIDTIVVRLNTNGALDTGFDSDGVKIYSISSGTDYGNDVVIQPADQKIVVGGVAFNGSNLDFAVSRLNTDGTPDTSFDTDGITTAGISGDDRLLELALQSDGRIIGAGQSIGAGGNNDFSLIRLNTNGSLDTTFDGDGKVQTDFGASRDDVGRKVAIQANGKIVQVGETNTFNGSRYDYGVIRYNTDGSLDTTFDGDGKLLAQFNANNSISTAVAVQTDSKIVVAGRSNWATVDFGVMRFNVNGSLDTSWGSGKVSLDFAGTNEDGRSVARQTDGKLLVLGRSLIGGNFAVGLSRYNINGTLDTTFDGDGKVTTQINSTYPQAVAMQADGKIVVAGFNFTGANYDFLLLRYNSNGSLDTSFDGDGIATLNITTNDELYDVAIQSDGKIVAVGAIFNGASDDYVVLRYNTDGSLDTTFDGDGRANTSMTGGNDQAHCVAIQPDGKILAAGMATPSSNDFSIARYNTNGSLDTSFNSVGYAVVVNNGFNEVVDAIALQSDGKIVVAGHANGGASADDFALARFNDNGTLDTSFDIDGKVTTSFSNNNDQAYGVAIQPDGKILVSGFANNGHTNDFAFARYNSDGSPDNSFNGNGRRFLDFSGYNEIVDGSGDNLILQSDGKAVVIGTSSNGINTDIGIARIEAFTPEPQVQFSLPSYSVNEGGGTATITVTRLGDVSAAASVEYATSNGTATGGSDYTATSGTLNFMSNQASNAFAIPITNDTGVETSETINITLSNPVSTTLGTPSTVALTIIDDDAAGSLDTTFGTGGKTTTAFSIGDDVGRGVAIQADGKVVVAGYFFNGSTPDFAVARYDTNGSLDTSFDGDGKVTTTFGSSDDLAYVVAIQADGKIVVAGEAITGSTYDYAIARYNPDGSLDTSFDADGRVTADFGGSDDRVYGMAIQSDGKIVVVGESHLNNFDISVARFNPNGSLDTSFDGDGKVLTSFATGEDRAQAVAIQSDGKIVVAGSTDGGSTSLDFALVRYNSNGSLDTTFDGDGMVTTAFGTGNDVATGVLMQSDGRIVATGSSSQNFAVARYNANGSLDTSFDGDGKVTTDFGGIDVVRGVAIQPDGKIVTGGFSSYNGSNFDFTVARYRTDGSLDTSFDGDGKATTDFFNGDDQGFDVAIQADGQIVVAGTAFNPSTGNDFAIARYNGTPCVSSPTGVVSWWHGNGNANDSVGSNNGSLQSGATFATGISGLAFSFNGNGYVQAPASGLPTGNGNRTMELWVYANSFPVGLNESFFAGYGNFGSADQTFHMGTTGSTLFISTWGSALNGPQMSTGNWHHVAATNTGNLVTLYLDGLAVNSASIAIATPAGTQFEIGRIPGALGDTRKLNGLVDEPTIYNRALSASEILAIYQSGSGGKCFFPCTGAIDRDHQSFAANGGAATVNITASCDWTANTTSPFITITSASSGTGDAVVQYTVAPNPGSTIRSDTITIAGHTFTVYQGINFADVPSNDPFYDVIGKLSARGVTLGCGGGNYCPSSPVTREQMAAFIMRARGEFSPPPPASQRFNDVPPQNVFYSFIDRLAVLNITLGCTPDHLMYCPSDPVKREQMSAFLLRGLGEFSPPTPASQRFNDVPPANVFYSFIDRLAVLNITLGCTPDHLLYCPNDSVTRAQMAAFLVRAFNL